MKIKTRIIDYLGQPRLLPLREQVRRTRNIAKGAITRARMQATTAQVPGLLSVVVPMFNVEDYIGACIASLLKQNYPNIQIIIVDDGSPDGSYQIARSYARRDPRVQIVRQANGGLSAARNTGIRHARGEYLSFLDSDDFVDRHCFTEAIQALKKTGSDFAVLPYRREKNGSFPGAAPWVKAAHRVQRLSTTLNEFPDIMVNAVAWSKVYRRDFWDCLGLEFPVGLLYEDQAISMAAYAHARTFDVLSRVSINWRIRADQSSITQQVTSARNVADHALAVQDSLSVLEETGHAEAARVRVLQIMNNNLGEFLPGIRQMDEPAWEQFEQFLQLLTGHADADMWAKLEARKKIMIGLCLAGERDLALRFLEAGGWDRDHFAGRVQGDRLYAEVPLQDELEAVLPESSFYFSPLETQLHALARSTRQQGHTLIVDAIAYINHLRMDREPTELSATLIAPSGKRYELDTEHRSDAWAAYGHTRRYADMAESAISIIVPFEVLDETGNYDIDLTLSCGQVTREGSLSVDGRTAYCAPELIDEERVVALQSGEGAEAFLAVRQPVARLVSVKTWAEHARFCIRSDRPLKELALVLRHDRFTQIRGRASLKLTGEGELEAFFTLPKTWDGSFSAVEYRVLAVEHDGTAHQLFFQAAAPKYSGRSYLAPYRHHANEEAGGALLVDLRESVMISGATVGDRMLEFSVNTAHLTRQITTGTAVRGSTQYALNFVPETGALTLDLEHDAWGIGTVGLKPGSYQFSGVLVDGTKLPVYFSTEFVRRAPFVIDNPRARFVFDLSRGPERIKLSISAPLTDQERGGGNQWMLRDWFATLKPSEPRSVLFRNLYSEAANDSSLAVHHELQRRGSNLELIWAVQNASVWVPEGARRVVEGSREYYEAFGTANYVMVNVHQPIWYRKPEGQVLIETFHGYPFKMNGRRWWQKLDFSVERQESFFRRAEEWDYLVSPARYATAVLEEFFREGGNPATEFLEIGYPRNDALLNEHAAQLRERTRTALGISEQHTVILYAPTFRDYLSGDDMTAKLVELLNPEQLMDDLGKEYVLLLRGHPFNARAGTHHSTSFINVTDYPDINHLILASDVGVLDYSSLRFDYALTGKPSLYFVPDLERYFKGREGFVPYESTSPGPQLRTHDELVEAIRNAERVAGQYEPARQRFISEYMELEDGHAAERLVDRVFTPRGDA